jgi:hypothetical protein
VTRVSASPFLFQWSIILVALILQATTVRAANDIPVEFRGTWGYVSEDKDSCTATEFSKVDHVFRIGAKRIEEFEHSCEVLEVTLPMKDDSIETQKRIDVRLRCSGEDLTWVGSGSLVIQDAPSGPLLVAAMTDGQIGQDQMLGYRAPVQTPNISIARRCQK